MDVAVLLENVHRKLRQECIGPKGISDYSTMTKRSKKALTKLHQPWRCNTRAHLVAPAATLTFKSQSHYNPRKTRYHPIDA